MKLKIYNLASGSRGNSTVISDGTTYIMVDAGISYREITRRMTMCEVGALKALLVTHEHIDHIRCANSLSEQGVKVYAHENIMGYIGVADVEPLEEREFYIGDICVTPFRVPHDSRYNLGYTFSEGGSKVGVLTDVGHINDAIFSHLCDCESLLIESNHDISMLLNGKYPTSLKNRILSNNGHLSNDACACTVERLIRRGALRQIMLGHLSDNNNTRDLADGTTRGILKGLPNRDIELVIARQNSLTNLL